MSKRTNSPQVDPLEHLINEWKSLLADRGITPESEAELRTLGREQAAALLTTAIGRLSRITR
jgi:hypothetical protein